MADMIVFDEERERQLQVKRLIKGIYYKFSRLVRAKFRPLSGRDASNLEIQFSGGEFTGCDGRLIVFKGIPVCDPGDFGECEFWFDSGSTNVTLKAVKPES